jgi:hypothetical protein
MIAPFVRGCQDVTMKSLHPALAKPQFSSALFMGQDATGLQGPFGVATAPPHWPISFADEISSRVT